MLQNSYFSHKGPFDAVVVSCVRPHRRPIPHASVAHEGMISELHGADLIKIAQGCQQNGIVRKVTNKFQIRRHQISEAFRAEMPMTCQYFPYGGVSNSLAIFGCKNSLT